MSEPTIQPRSRYYKFSQYLQETFGEKVWKISLDAGFSCPNRDVHGKEGCIFCRNESFSHMLSHRNLSIAEQMQQQIDMARSKYGLKRYIAYFQASTNTYAPVEYLRQVYSEALQFEGVVGLAISTRPDAIPKNVFDLIAEFASKTVVWIELGLQSAHDRTLQLLNRGHSFKQYQEAVKNLKTLPVRICTHLMLGLPGESHQDVLKTVHAIARSETQAVKIHPLLILKETKLADMYSAGEVEPLELDGFVTQVCDVLEHLPPKMVIQRLTAEAPQDMLIAPLWSMNKLEVLNKIEAELERRGTFQGSKFEIDQ